MFLGLSGLAATNGSKASSRVQELPGKDTKWSSQVPTALGRDSSMRGPRVEAVTGATIARELISLA
jgi:hypothetical protein